MYLFSGICNRPQWCSNLNMCIMISSHNSQTEMWHAAWWNSWYTCYHLSLQTSSGFYFTFFFTFIFYLIFVSQMLACASICWRINKNSRWENMAHEMLLQIPSALTLIMLARANLWGPTSPRKYGCPQLKHWNKMGQWK